MDFKTVATTALEWLPTAAALMGGGLVVTAGAIALPMVVGSIRNARATKAQDIERAVPQTIVNAPLPTVLEYVPPAPMVSQPMGTMMGESPKEGDFAQRYKNQRAGINAGPDVSMPNITRPDGRNAIDGASKVEELNAPSANGRMI